MNATPASTMLNTKFNKHFEGSDLMMLFNEMFTIWDNLHKISKDILHMHLTTFYNSITETSKLMPEMDSTASIMKSKVMEKVRRWIAFRTNDYAPKLFDVLNVIDTGLDGMDCEMDNNKEFFKMTLKWPEEDYKYRYRELYLDFIGLQYKLYCYLEAFSEEAFTDQIQDLL